MMHAEKTCHLFFTYIIAQFSGIMGEFDGTIHLLFVNIILKKNQLIVKIGT